MGGPYRSGSRDAIRDELTARALPAPIAAIPSVRPTRVERVTALLACPTPDAEQTIPLVEQFQYPLRRRSRLRPVAERPQLSLDFGQAIGGSGPH